MSLSFTSFLPQETYLKDPFVFVKENLLGSYLCTSFDSVLTAGRITEAEVYLGKLDKASHSYGMRRTKRTEVQFEKGGKAYIFFVYGMHVQFCVTLGEENDPVCVLIRSLEPVAGIDKMMQRRKSRCLENLTTGPGKLCQALGILREHNALSLTQQPLWICPGERISSSEIASSPRIGVAYAGEDALNPWRFFLKKNPFVSHARFSALLEK